MRSGNIRIWASIVASVVLCALPALASDGPSLESRVRAAFLFNFVQFTEWPAGTFANDGDPIVIGVLKPDPLEGALETAVAGKTINNRKVIVKYLKEGDDLSGCQLLYISNAN